MIGLSNVGAALAVDIYETDFESFSVGSDQLVGTDGWVGTNANEGVHGIDEGLIEGLGKTAFLGFNPPTTDFVSVAHPVAFDPLGQGLPTVEFFAFIGVADSTNGLYDRFYISFYNGDDDLLAAIALDNTPADFGVLRYDGSELIHTGELFVNDAVQALFVSIDFSKNTWSAKLDGLPLFTNETFNATGSGLLLGSIAAEWEVVAPGDPGNNWMLFDEWTVTAKSAVDVEFPVISGMPSNITTGTDTGEASAVVQWQEPTAADNVGVASFVSTHESGSTFAVGKTDVVYTATDAAGNVASATFAVVVEDRELPTVTGSPGDLVFAVTPAELPKVVTWQEPTASDNVAVAEFTSDHRPGDAFSEGVTTVTYTARDTAGNVEFLSFRLTIQVTSDKSSPYDEWLETHFKTLQVDPLADADNDSLSNIFEFGIGTDPLQPEGTEGMDAVPRMVMNSFPGSSELFYEFVTATQLEPGVVLELQQSSALTEGNWQVVASRSGNGLWGGPAVDAGKLQVIPVESGKSQIRLVEQGIESLEVRFYRLTITVAIE